MTKKPPPKNTKEQLDLILHYLNKINKRDRLRTIGGFFRGILGLIPIAVMLFALWYAYAHGDELLEKITKMAAEQATSMTTESINMDAIQKLIQGQ